MKNKKLLAYAILAICLKEFISHMVGTNKSNILVDDKHKIMTPEPEDYTEAAIVTDPDIAINHLLDWILDSLDKHEMVILYTCRDESYISIEDPAEWKQLHPSLELLENSDFPELKNILLIAYD